MGDSNLSNEQFGAIRRSIELGRTLKEDHPEIAVIYGYYSQADIPKMLGIQSKYGVSDDIAVSGVRRAIVGHEEGFGIEGYVGLITDEGELKRLREGRRAAGGQKTYEQGIGVHGRTAEQMSEDGLIGGQKTYEQEIGVHGRTAEQMSEHGRKSYEQRIGVHGRTAEQMSEHGRKSYEQRIGVHGRTAEQKSEDIQKSLIARGLTPWSDEEKEFAYMLSQEQEYQYPNGSSYAGKTNNELVAFALNMEYHDCKEVRSTKAVNLQLCSYRKSLVDIVV